jgi:hypothetical protein
VTEDRLDTSSTLREPRATGKVRAVHLSPLLAGAAAVAALAAPSVASAASSTVTTPTDGTPFVYDNAGHPGVVAAVDGTAAGAAQVDLRCAAREGGTWSFSSILPGGAAVDATSGSFHATNVTLPAQQQNCLLLALPTGVALPADPSGYGGPRLRLLATLLTGAGLTDNKGGANQGKVYDFVAFANGTGADTLWSSAADGGVESLYLLAPSPEEAGQVFSTSDAIPSTDPTTGPGPTATSTGVTVDATNAYLGPTWEDAVTPALQIPFGGLAPFPTVTATPSLGADGGHVVDEHDLIVQCTGADPNYFSPAGFTCPPLRDTGVALDLRTSTAPKGTVVTRRWTFSSTDGLAHTVRLVLDNRAGATTPARTFRFPGEPGYAAHTAGDVVAPPASGPWTTRWHSEGAADGDASKGVGAITSSLVPVALRFISARGYDATYAITVPAGGSAELRNVLMGEATQAALEDDITAAEGRGGGGGAVVSPATTPPAGAAPSAPAPAGPAPITAPVKRPAPKPAAPALKATTIIGLPAAKQCVSRRRLTLHLHPPKGTKLKALTVKVAKRTTHPKLHGTAPVVLSGLPKGKYTVTVTVRLADGRTVRLSRAYRTCAPKRKH